MQAITPSDVTHAAPNPGFVAVAYAVLFILGLYFVISFSPDSPHYPNPSESGEVIAVYFQNHPDAVLLCALFQFCAAIPLGIFTAAMTSRLQFLGARVAGVSIALFGGLMAAFDIALAALILWVIAYPGIAQEVAVLRALYYLTFAVGGVGLSVPLGLLIAGISVPAGFMKLLPKWLVIFGLILAVIGEISVLSMVFPSLLFLIPLTRFPGFVWLILAGFMLPKQRQNIQEAVTAD